MEERFVPDDGKDFRETTPVPSRYFPPAPNPSTPEPRALHRYFGTLYDPSAAPAASAVPARAQNDTVSKRKRTEPKEKKEKKERAKRKPSAKKAAAAAKPELPQGPIVTHHLGNAGGGLGGFNQSQPRSRMDGMLLDPNDWLEASHVEWDHSRAAAAHAAVVRIPLPAMSGFLTLCAGSQLIK